jgi:hypothetical protein
MRSFASPVTLEGAVPVEMVRLEVQENRGLELELVHVLELEGRELAHDPRVLGSIDRAQRAADVSRHDDLAAGGAEDRAEQLGRRALALRPVTPHERARTEEPIAELDPPTRPGCRVRAPRRRADALRERPGS